MKNINRIIIICILIFSSTFFFGCNTLSVNQVNNAPLEHDGNNIRLDKDYYNEEYKFGFKYPGMWKININENVQLVQDRGIDITIYIDNDNENYINVYGEKAVINYGGEGMDLSDFYTNDGTKCKMYSRNTNDLHDINIIYDNFHGAHVIVSNAKYEKYGDVIMNILKSVRVV